METKFCPDCGLIVTPESGLDLLGQLRHRPCVQRAAMRIIGDVFCGVDDEMRAAVRGVKNDWQRFVALLCLTADKLAMSNAPALMPGEQRYLEVLFQMFVAPRFTEALGGLPPEEVRELERQMLS